jgi:hypothetical protein
MKLDGNLKLMKTLDDAGIARIGIHLTSVMQKKLLYTGQVNLNQQEDDQIINQNQLNF